MLRCLDCGGELRSLDEGTGEPGLACDDCGRRYEVIAGVVDLRPPVEGYDVAADRALALELAGTGAGASFEALLRRYWAAQADVDPALAEGFVVGDLIGADRAAAVLGQIEQLLGPGSLDVDVAVEIGCGTAALGSVLASSVRHVIVTDISLSWLVLARRRLDEAGIANVTVVAATGDHLPLAPGAVDLVVGADVIEHVPDPTAVVRSCAQVLKPGAALWLSTPNRYSLTPEPHVHLWGVGWLPRPLALRYVRRCRGTDYGDVHTLSARGLRVLLEGAGGTVTVTAPEIAPAQRARYGTVGRALIGAYHVARRLPGVSALLRWVGPLLHGVGRAPA